MFLPNSSKFLIFITLYKAFLITEYESPADISETLTPSFCTCLTFEFINTVHLEPKSTGLFELIANLNLDLKVLPYGFAVSVADSKITTLNSDDGLWGSMALYLEHDHQKLGYVAKFDIHGIHKKRIKAWKKFFSQQKLDYLILGYQDRDDSDNYLSKTGQLKNIEKTLEQADSTQIYLEMTPFDPEQLVKIDDLAHRLDYQIKWLPGYAELISYFKQLDFKEGSPAATDKTLIQREAQAHIVDDLTISSPLLAEDGKIDFMNNFAYPTEAELKEILKYIAAKHVYFV